MNNQTLISIITPVYNGGKVLPHCLEALRTSSYHPYEILVVDDGSTDDSAEIARKKGATVYTMPVQSGPAAARNFGAQKARGEILFFVDADVVVRSETVCRVAADFDEHPEIAAVFGSYDAEPAETNFVSQYKNLYHHFVHQSGKPEAVTFWAGCGAVRRSAFEALSGFDSNLYPTPCIEDIELGYRLRAMGQRILLDKSLQCKHLKRWTLKSLLRADIFHRAVPWSQLILKSNEVVNDLNLQTKDRLSTALVGLSALALPFSIFRPQLLIGIVGALTIVFLLNYKLYGFFLRLKGPGFVVLAFLMQLLHYCYSGTTFAICWFQHKLNSKRRTRAIDLNEEEPTTT